MLAWLGRFRLYERVAVLIAFIILLVILQHCTPFQSLANPVFSATIFHPIPTYRLRIIPECTCVVPGDSSVLSVQFCDPTQQHDFQFNNADQLVYTVTGDCVTISGEELVLRGCSEASIKFGKQSPLQFVDHSEAICVWTYNSETHLDSRIKLVPCISNHSKIELIREHVFLQKNKALLTVAPVPQEDCDFPACGINDGPGEVVLLPPSEVVRCTDLTTCLTVVVKTARRPHLVLRLAQSIRDTRGHDLPMVAYDDGGEPYPEEMMAEISQFPLLRYIVDEEEDLGIARGRNLAIQHADTKYIMLVDDDMLFTENDTDIDAVVSMFDTTDLSLVGGRIYNSEGFSGTLQFVNDHTLGKRLLLFGKHKFKGYGVQSSGSVINFPSCVHSDITSNIFIARKDHILEVGGWAEELKIREHKDLFLKLKAANMKVAFCPHFQLLHHRSPSPSYYVLRSEPTRSKLCDKIFKNIWNIHKHKVRYVK